MSKRVYEGHGIVVSQFEGPRYRGPILQLNLGREFEQFSPVELLDLGVELVVVACSAMARQEPAIVDAARQLRNNGHQLGPYLCPRYRGPHRGIVDG